MAVKLLLLIAAFYTAVLFIKKTVLKISLLFILDIIAAFILYFFNTPSDKIIVFISIAFSADIFIFIASGNEDATYQKNKQAFLYAVLSSVVVGLIFFCIKNDNNILQVTTKVNDLVPAIFFTFCVAFSAVYFFVKEEAGGNISE